MDTIFDKSLHVIHTQDGPYKILDRKKLNTLYLSLKATRDVNDDTDIPQTIYGRINFMVS